MTLLDSLRHAMRQRAAYTHTVRELRGVPRGLSEDLAIYPGDAERLARQAVYGF